MPPDSSSPPLLSAAPGPQARAALMDVSSFQWTSVTVISLLAAAQ